MHIAVTWVQISLASDTSVLREKKSHFLGDLLINAKLGVILSLSSLPFVTNWSGGVSAQECSRASEGQHAHTTAFGAFCACLWEPPGQQRRWMPCEVLSHPFLYPGWSRRVGQPPPTELTCSRTLYWCEGWWKANSTGSACHSCCFELLPAAFSPSNASSLLLMCCLLEGGKELSYLLNSPYLSLRSSTALQACLSEHKHFGI